MSVDDCNVTEQTIAAFVAQELPEDEELSVAVHLGTCRACCNQAADYTVLRGAMTECHSDDAVRWDEFQTRAGPVRAAIRSGKVIQVSWAADESAEEFADETRTGAGFAGPVLRDSDALSEARRQIMEYMDGERDHFDLEFDLEGCRSPFQREVLEAARAIPYGSVISYGELAKRIGKPRASRAVGNALGANPVPIVIPCHRVVRGDGSAGGYVGGTERKIKLLQLEGSPVRAA